MSLRRWLLLGVLYVCLIVGGLLAGQWLADTAGLDVRPSSEPDIHAMVMLTTVVYVVTAAIPFVPGAEIGFTLILVLGAPIIPVVYIAMVAALHIAFVVGRFVPGRAIAAVFQFFGLRKGRHLVLEMAPLGAHERLALLTARAPTRIIPFLLRHRHVALAVALNIPGNTLAGGGGGIAMAAGMSGLYSIPAFAITVALAVAPIPLVVLIADRLWG